MNFNLIHKDIDSISGQTLIVFSKVHGEKKNASVQISLPKIGNKIQPAIDDKLITGTLLETIPFREWNQNSFRHLVIIGLGKESELTHENARQAAAAAYECCKTLKTTEIFFQFDGLCTEMEHAPSFSKAVAEGLTLASYSLTELKSTGVEKEKKSKKEPLQNMHIVSRWAQNKEVKKSFEEGLTIGECVNFSRRLGDLPGNKMTPSILAESAMEAAKGTGVKVTVWDKARIQKEKMGGLLGVSQGSGQDPRFIIMEYKGASSSKKPLVFVGKGLTFDCGGISIKPSASMEDMKFDMCGGANVIGTLIAIAKLKLKINVVGLIPATENLVGPFATKPGDIHTARNGKTFEVNNTDAEGRLILADALSYASELDPQLIVDAATLTGAMVMALGNTHTGYFTRNQGLKTKIELAATNSGEWIWNLPLCDFHKKDIQGTWADISNISSGKGAGSATAAAFLEHFVQEEIPWAHFDIAGTGWAVGNRLNYCTKKGASGVMLRTFVELAKQFA